ncbi:hypothetical protein ABLN87_21265 [Ruegeria sp. SCPT10]|uniref:nucleotidyltransferase domain-containing protein n=1 Tax=Ruegeria sp. SCP10 TaxID=3141377 RepID=UPI0033387114
MNTPETVTTVLAKLAELRIVAALCGGWAEEALGIIPPRPHKDIDIVVEANDFSAIDQALIDGELKNEIAAKRFAHKRAFVFSETMVEMYLVQNRANGLVTMFWGDTEYVWRDPLVAVAQLHGTSIRTVHRKTF